LARLKAEFGTTSGKQFPWWKEIARIFADDPAFEEAMSLGQIPPPEFRGGSPQIWEPKVFAP
jgi:hypothetical protein